MPSSERSKNEQGISFQAHACHFSDNPQPKPCVRDTREQVYTLSIHSILHSLTLSVKLSHCCEAASINACKRLASKYLSPV